MNDSEIRLEIATRAAGIGIWDWDLLTDQIVYSPAARVISGFDPDQVITLQDVRALTHCEDSPHAADMAAKALDPALRTRAAYEYRIVRPDGAVRNVVAHGEAIFAQVEGVERAVRYIGSLQDITERKRLEEAERRASDRLQLALDAGRMAVWEYDVTTERVSGSPELYRLLGFPEDAQPSLEALRGGFEPEDVGCIARAAQAAWKGGERFLEVEFRYRRLDGAWRWYQLRAEIKLGSSGLRQTLLGVLIDVTERKSAEDRLRDSEARFRGMADSAPAPVWITGIDGGVEFVNQAFVEIAGIEAGSLLGDVWIQLIHADDLLQVARARMAARETLSSYKFEARFKRIDGEYRWMFVSAKPRFDPTGGFLGYVGLAIDLTELRAAETRQRLLINELNHRVKNTLASVQSIARQTLREGQTAGAARELLLDRIMAMSVAHDILTRESWEGAAVHDIVLGAIQPFVGPDATRIHVSGPAGRLGPSAALALALALHELSTNAVKYGALSTSEGRVDIVWEPSGDGRNVKLRWKEHGGPPVVPPVRKGFGSRLLDGGLAADLGGRPTLFFAPDGVEAVVPIMLTD